MSKLSTALGRGFPVRERLRVLLFLVGLGAGGLVVVFFIAVPAAHPVTLNFLRATNEDGREVVAWEINNRLPREVWWRIQTGGTNYLSALTLESYDGTNYQSGVWHGIGQYSGEPPVMAHSSWRPFYANPNVQVKSGERVWLVWTAQPKSEPVARGALDRGRLNVSYFLSRHGWRRAAALLRPRSNGLHVQELVVP